MATLTKDLQRFVWAFISIVACCCTGNPIRRNVPDGVVYTDLHKTVEIGSRVVLKCQFHGPPHAVYWKKGDNPSNAPNLITWAEGEADSGSCVKDKTCEMGDDISLIIKNVSIADQGRYICRISNYRGILMHNVTDLKVYATPEESYPVIQECEGYHGQNCTVDHSTSINITCSASRYFPNIDLLFLHGAQTVTNIKTFEWTNADGTKSKYISTRAPPSKIPYVCVAFNIPGSQDERTATILVFHQDTNGTSGSAGESGRDKNLTIKIVVSVGVSVLGLCIPVLLCCSWCKRKKKRKHGHDGTDEERTPLLRGPVSLYELWYLASCKTTEDHMEKLRKAFLQMHIPQTKGEQLTPLKAYKDLCTWREGTEKVDQQMRLKGALEKVQYATAWHDMDGKRNEKSVEVSQEALRQILRHVGNIYDVNQFLKKLFGNEYIKGESEHVLNVGLVDLKYWISRRQFDVNPFVLLSFALESCGCDAIHMVDFWVPARLQSPISEEEVEKLTNKLTARHCKRLASNLKMETEMDTIILGNNRYLFDTKSMITGWLGEPEWRNNYKKRCKLDDAIIMIGRYDLQDIWGTSSYRRDAGLPGKHPHPDQHQFDIESIFDDDIPQLVKLVTCLPEKLKFQEMELSPHENDDIVEGRMKEWRNNIIASSSKEESLNKFQSLRKELTRSTNYTEFTLTDEEIEKVASEVTLPDQKRELVSTLHIETDVQQKLSLAEQLKTWRNTQARANCRDALQQALERLGLAKCIESKSTTKIDTREELPRIALDLVMEDVRPIIKALDIEESTVHNYVKRWDGEGSCTIELVMKLLKNRGTLRKRDRDREGFCQVLRNIGFVDVARSVYFGRCQTENQKDSNSNGDMPNE